MLRRETTSYVESRVAEYRAYWQSAARRLGADFIQVTPSVWEVQLDGRRTRILNHMVQLDDPVTLALSGDKEFCYKLATEEGLPVPSHRVFGAREVEAALSHQRDYPGPKVVKPASGSSAGLGVTTNVRTAGQLLAAFGLASLFAPRVIVERMVFGESCRLLYLNGELIHAVRRRGVRLLGNGKSSVSQLLASNAPSGLPESPLIAGTLEAQGLAFDSIVPAGHEFVVSGLPPQASSTELRTVYDEDISDIVSSRLRAELQRVVQALGSRFVGVDIITNHPGGSLGDTGGAFLELNTLPGIHHHFIRPGEVETSPVAVRVLEAALAARPASTLDIPSQGKAIVLA